MPISNSQSQAVPKPQQLLLRLPDELAQRFAQVVPSRQRSRFLLNLLRNELDRESIALAEAAKTLTAMESGGSMQAQESAEWVGSALATDDDAQFDAGLFENDFEKAQAALALPGK
jgi:predicted transcriptional regulator